MLAGGTNLEMGNSNTTYETGNGDGPYYQEDNDLLFDGEHFRQAIENVKMGIVVQDNEGRIYKTNSALERVTGFTKQELHRKRFADLFHPDDIHTRYSPISELLSGERVFYDIETRLIDKKSQVLWTRLVGSLIKTEEGKLYNIVLIDNISERKESEKIKDAFVDMVAHELKNPLMAVISSLRLAKKDGQFPDVLHELIGIASDGAESLWAILENLLEVSRARAGRLKLSPVRSDVSQLITDVITTIRQTLIHRLITDVPENLPQILVDPARFHLVLRNLIDNAIKYSPKGGNILVFVRYGKGEIVVGVKDEGIGISKANIQNLFQPFERLGTTSAMGTGLGLVVCRILVTYHRGRIWVDSEPEKGSTFYFALPLNYQEIKA